MQYSTHLLRHLRFTIGQNIQHYRVHHKMPLRKLARITRINESRLDQFELGKNEIRLDELLKIACALGAEIEEMIESNSRTAWGQVKKGLKESAEGKLFDRGDFSLCL